MYNKNDKEKYEQLINESPIFSLDKERITSSIPFTNRRIPRIHPMARKVLIGLTRVQTPNNNVKTPVIKVRYFSNVINLKAEDIYS